MSFGNNFLDISFINYCQFATKGLFIRCNYIMSIASGNVLIKKVCHCRNVGNQLMLAMLCENVAQECGVGNEMSGCDDECGRARLCQSTFVLIKHVHYNIYSAFHSLHRI